MARERTEARRAYELEITAWMQERGVPVSDVRVLSPVRGGGVKELRVLAHGAVLHVTACCARHTCAGWVVSDAKGRRVRSFADLAVAFRGVGARA